MDNIVNLFCKCTRSSSGIVVQSRESGVSSVSFACRFGAASRPQARVRNGLHSETGNTDDSLRLHRITRLQTANQNIRCQMKEKYPWRYKSVLGTLPLNVLQTNSDPYQSFASQHLFLWTGIKAIMFLLIKAFRNQRQFYEKHNYAFISRL